jgi:hypothetical protein
MRFARLLRVFATHRRGTVVRTNLRLAAGVGVVATCVLVGGHSVAVAIADPGGGNSGHSDNRKGSHNDSGNGSRGGPDSNDDNLNSGSRGGPTSGSHGRPSSRVGSGRDSGTSDQRPSSDYSPDSPQFKTPKVTIGDGRTPGVQAPDTEPRWRGEAPEPAPPPPPEVIAVPLNPPTVNPGRETPGVVRQLAVAPASRLGDPLWGVAGLLLIPAAGAVLGVRQARASQAAAELGRRP